jgi:hypothetical protein
MAKKKPKPDCGCLEKANEAVKEKGYAFQTRVMFHRDSSTLRVAGPLLLLEKLDSKSRKPLPSAFCAYCPFCGKKKQ